MLELYLSVKIRSDDEIDHYDEAKYKEEKLEMQEVDGFSLVDYVKQSIEILMNMKMDGEEDDDDGYAYDEDSGATHYELTDPNYEMQQDVTI